MNLCSYEHEEICHETRYCPMCKMMAEHAEVVGTLNDKVKELEEEIENLEAE